MCEHCLIFLDIFVLFGTSGDGFFSILAAHILNLSHGVDRRTPVDNVRAFLRTAGARERA